MQSWRLLTLQMLNPHIRAQKPEKPAAAKPAKSTEKADIAKELTSAQKLGEQLETLVVQRGQFPDDDRNVLLMAYWALIFDFRKSILRDVRDQLYGSAFALVRPCIEALVRAHVAVKGSDKDIKKLQNDTYHTDFDKIGQWMDKEFATEKLFTNFIGGAKAALHSFTHVGLSQIGRRLDGHNLKPAYDDGEILEVVRSTTSVVWMVTNLVTIHSDSPKRRIRLRACISNGASVSISASRFRHVKLVSRCTARIKHSWGYPAWSCATTHRRT